MTNVIIWNENIHEVENEEVKKIYPNGIHGCIKDFLSTGNYNDLIVYKDRYHGIGFNILSQPFQYLIKDLELR